MLQKAGGRSREGSRAGSRRGSLAVDSGEGVPGLQAGQDEGRVNRPFLKKLPERCEAAVVLEGRSTLLAKPVSVFIRLRDPVVLGDLPEVDIPTKAELEAISMTEKTVCTKYWSFIWLAINICSPY